MQQIPWDTVFAIAAELKIETADARRKWKERGRVPYKWRIPILQEASRRGVLLSAVDLGQENRAA
jgi:hypothetical protein